MNPPARLALFLSLSLAATTPLTAATGTDDTGVLIRFGMQDREGSVWNGSVSVSPGEVARVNGYRFEEDDAVLEGGRWRASTRAAPGARPRSNNPGKSAKNARGPRPRDNGVLVTLRGATPASEVRVQTEQGGFTFQLGTLSFGRPLAQLDGQVEVERVPVVEQVTTSRTDDDYPALARGKDGTMWLAYVAFTPGLDRDMRLKPLTEAPSDYSWLATPAGGDQVLLRSKDGTGWSQPLAITEYGRDVYRCAVATGPAGAVWVIWSERRDGNFDLWARNFYEGRLSNPIRLTQTPGNDLSPVAASDSAGRVWVAWQGAEGGRFRIFAARQLEGGTWSEPFAVSPQQANCWMPSIAGNPKEGGGVAIAWDTYEAGNYDVWLREYAADGSAQDAVPAADGLDFEASSSVAYDPQGRLWVGWEIGGPMWAKDFGTDPNADGTPIDLSRQIGLRVREGGVWQAAPAGFQDALPTKGEVVRFVPPPGEDNVGRLHAAVQEGEVFNKMANLVVDGQGRVWLVARARNGGVFHFMGRTWANHACYFDGDKWVGPILLPESDNMLHKRPALLGAPGGGLHFAHATDDRFSRDFSTPALFSLAFGGFQPTASSQLGFVEDVFDNDIHFGTLTPGQPAVKPFTLVAEKPARPSREELERAVAIAAKDRAERAAVQRCRDQRLAYNGAQLRILRGEFHRHTELSTCQITDGTLEDMWRYALDVAAMDWIGNGDHDNGGGREYPWWLTQKMTDAYHLPGHFDPLFAYERSVPYPEGHRNILFVQRGVRTLPRLPLSPRNQPAPAPDTQMLYQYLRYFDGICASHTSVTGMGTDWRDNDPAVEPMVEIYQGCRQNYERPGAPRCVPEDLAKNFSAGWINNALLKGYKFAFQASSDHWSTHISYGMVYAKEASRRGIHDAMKARHVYAATDNIVAEFGCRANGRDYMLGDEFTTREAPELRLKLVGTAPFRKVTLIKDDVEVKVWEPGQAEFAVTWKDPAPTAGKTSYYYVRGEQEDAELVWVSPMWITMQ